MSSGSSFRSNGHDTGDRRAAVSLDGYFEDAEGNVDVLYSDVDQLVDSAYMKASQADTGAVLMGRRTVDMAPDPTATPSTTSTRCRCSC